MNYNYNSYSYNNYNYSDYDYSDYSYNYKQTTTSETFKRIWMKRKRRTGLE